MSRYIQRFNPRCMICKRAGRVHTAIELLRSDNNGAWVRCRICGRQSRRRSWAARHRAMSPDLSTLPSTPNDNQLGAHLCQMWDEQRANGMVSGQWSPKSGRFVTLEEWVKMKEQEEANR